MLMSSKSIFRILLIAILFVCSGNACFKSTRSDQYLFYINKKEKGEVKLYLKRLEEDRAGSDKELIKIVRRIGDIGDADAIYLLKKSYPKRKRIIRSEIRKAMSKIHNRGKNNLILKKLITSKHPDKRIKGIKRLRKYFDHDDKKVFQKVIPVINEISLTDTDESVSLEAIRFLGFFRVSESADVLLNKLSKTKSHQVRAVIEKALVEMRDPVLPKLIDIYMSDDERLDDNSKNIIEHTILAGKAYSIQYLQELFYKTDDILIKNKVVGLLFKMKDDSAYGAMVSFLDRRDINQNVKCNIIKSLGRAKDISYISPLLDIVKEEALIYKDCLNAGLLYMGSQVSDQLNNLLKETPDRNIKIFLIKLLGRLKAVSAVEGIISYFNPDDIEMSRAVVTSLFRIGTIKTKELFLKIIRDDVKEFTDIAVDGLANLGTEILPDLRALLEDKKGDTDEPVLFNLLKILGKKKVPDFYNLIISIFLEHKSNRITSLALKVFTRFQIEDAERYIIPYLDHQDLSVRFAAMKALGALKSEKCISKIILMMAEEKKKVYRTILTNKAADTLIRIGSKAIPYLLEALEGENSIIREYSAWVLGNICDSRCIAPIKKMLKQGFDPQIFVYSVNGQSLSLTKEPVVYAALRMLELSD